MKYLAGAIGPEADFSTSYNDFVPSVTLGIKIGKTQNLRGGYNMRIWRPGIWNLNPYFDDRNPMFISQGNSNLESEKSHSFNLSYSMFSMKFNVNISLRHSFGNNGIERVSRLIGKGGEEFPGGHHAPEGALYSTYENIGKNRNTGLSLYGNWNASPNTRIYLNGDGSYVDIKSPAQGLHNYGWNASLYGGIQHTFPLKIRASLNAGGSTPYISLQGKGSGYYYYSLGVNRSFIKDRFTVSAYVSNIFEKYRSYNNTTMGENFLSKSSSRYQSRSFGISLSYRIGELKASVKKAARSINNDDVKGGGGQTQIRPSGKGRTKQWVIDDSLNMLDKVIGDEFGLIPPITFYGKTHTKQNAHELYAVAIDIDYVGKQQLKNLLKQFGNGVQLRPTYLVSSGKGVHAYYFLKEPVQLYHNLEDTLAELKEAFIRRLWNDTSSIRPDSPDITGIYQGFRCVGSQSKLGADFPVKAYKMSDNRYTLEDIKDSIPNCKVDLSVLTEKPKKEKSKLSLDEAKKLYPEWYQERVVEGRPKKKGTWVCNEALYEWWKNKIFTEVKVGGRYFSIMALCAYGLKCGISERRIRQDAYSFLEHLESLTDDEDNHFTREDVKDALKALKADNKLLSTMASREWIEKQTKVVIPPNKRNGRKQATHLKIARFTLETMNEDRGKALQGRPDKAKIVEEWRESNPLGTKADCIRETGLAKHTVYKWWK